MDDEQEKRCIIYLMFIYYKAKIRETVLFRIGIDNGIPELYCGYGNWSKLDPFIWQVFDSSPDKDKFIETISEEKARIIIEAKDLNLDKMESILASVR